MTRNITPTHKKIMSVVISAAVVNILIVIFLMVPTMRDIAKAKEENYQERLNALAKEQTQKEIIKLLKNKEALMEKMQTTQQLLISEPSFLQLIQNLENEAAKKNLTLTVDIEEKDEAKEKMNERAIHISMEGKWEDVIAFLMRTVNSPSLTSSTLMSSARLSAMSITSLYSKTTYSG